MSRYTITLYISLLLLIRIIGLAFSEDNQRLYVLGVAKNNTNIDTNVNTNTYMSYDSYLIIYDIDNSATKITTTTKVNGDTKTKGTSNTTTTTTLSNDTDVITLIKTMMININDRFDHIENVLRKHDDQLSHITIAIDNITKKL